MSRVQLLVLHLAMTTQKELCKVGLHGFSVVVFSFSFLPLPQLFHDSRLQRAASQHQWKGSSE